MLRILPPEILSRFVLFLYADEEEDIQALRTLAVTSSVFLQPCRSVIFYHIKLDDMKNQTRLHPNPNRKSPGEKVLDLVNSAPWVAKYCKKITIYDVFYTSWLSNDLKVAEALNKLNLQQIEHFVLHRGYRTQWLLLSPEIKAVIMKICQSPALVRLSVRRTPMSLLGVVRPTLKHLEILETVASPDEYIKSVPRDSPLSIQTLHIQHAHDLGGNIEWLVNSAKNDIRLDGLEKLHLVATNSDDHSRVPMLLEACKTSLKTFNFDPYPEISDPRSHFFDVAVCTALETLSMRVEATTPDFEGERNSLQWASNFISRISKSNVIRIHLLLEWELSDAPGDIENTSPSLFFSSLAYYLRTLGTAVCNTQKFPRIQELDIELKSTNPVSDDTPHIERFVKQAFECIPTPDLVTLRAQPHTPDGPWY
ncbi:hypothetical protein EST38_g9013 [Candolleomyces aberdarensis]|uniref:F-box domain-containing protein n=1 Tax=Candolleomyces aberdarensis TaxID=2316362 RepID=A0A4Q2DAZ8_9AGAR|nr:hypothetical protein EST38_g9013 [Candolleomyces aberdarensis]